MEKTNMKNNKRKARRIIAWLVLGMSICVMLLSGFKLRETQQVYQIGDKSYQALAERVHRAALQDPQGLQDTTGTMSGTGKEKEADTETSDTAIDFNALHAINPDAVAWLYSPGTAIDYPVMRATEYNYYLHHLPDGTYNANGTLFIDYNWADFNDPLTVIYGHNMKSGRMFGSLTGYKKQAYYNEHPYLYLYTEDGEKYRIDLIYGCVIGAGQWRDRAFMFKVNLDSLISYAAYNTTFTSKTQYTKGDRVVALSTCSYEFDNARYVVLGVLRPEIAEQG